MSHEQPVSYGVSVMADDDLALFFTKMATMDERMQGEEFRKWYDGMV